MFPTDETGVHARRILDFGFSCCEEKKVGENFVIVFTDARGSLEFVFCHWPNNQLILCISSALPWCACFHALLDIISRNELYRESKWPAFHPFLTRLLATRPPPQPIDYVTCQDPFSSSRNLKFRIPSSQSPHNLKYVMEYYNALDVSLWIHVFVCLILERSVLFYSKRLTRLTACVIAAVSLLYPLPWVHSFYPLIPKKVIEVLGCPVPFVAGIHSCNLPAALEQLNPGTCVVNLDAGQISLYQSSEFTDGDSDEEFSTPKAVYQFLRRHLKDVQRHLTSAMRPGKAADSNWKRVDGEACQFFEQLTRPFFYLIVNLLGCYSECVINNHGALEVDIELLIAHQKCPGLESFFRTLFESQAVQMFLEGRVQNPPDPSTDAFESMCSSLRDRSMRKRYKQRGFGINSAPTTPVPIATTLNGSTSTIGSGSIRGPLMESNFPSFGTPQWVQAKRLKNPGEACVWDKQENITQPPKPSSSPPYSWANISQKIRAQALTLRNISASKEGLSSSSNLDKRATIGLVRSNGDTTRRLGGYASPIPPALPERPYRPPTTDIPGSFLPNNDVTGLARPTSVISRSVNNKIFPLEAPTSNRVDGRHEVPGPPRNQSNTPHSHSSFREKPKPPPRPPLPRTLLSIKAAESRSQTATSQLRVTESPQQERPISPTIISPSQQHPAQMNTFNDVPLPFRPITTVPELISPNVPLTRTLNPEENSTGSRVPYADRVPPPIPPRVSAVRLMSRAFTPSRVDKLHFTSTSNLIQRRLAAANSRTDNIHDSVGRAMSQPIAFTKAETMPPHTMSSADRKPSYENMAFDDERLRLEGNKPSHLSRARSITVPSRPRPTICNVHLCSETDLDLSPPYTLRNRSQSSFQLGGGDSHSLTTINSGMLNKEPAPAEYDSDSVQFQRKYATFAERRRANPPPKYQLHRARTVSEHRNSFCPTAYKVRSLAPIAKGE